MSDSGESRAPQACQSCRKMKRGCDKTLPECTLCVRMKRTCKYEGGDLNPLPTPEDFHALQQKVSELESKLAPHGSDTGSGENRSSNTSLPSSTGSPYGSLASTGSGRLAGIGNGKLPTRFPAMFFLDSAYFEAGRLAIEKPPVQVPQEVVMILGDSFNMTRMVDEYFKTIHSWFPIGISSS